MPCVAAKGEHLLQALHGAFRLFGSGLVVKSGMQHAAVVAGLVRGQPGFFFQQQQFELRSGFQEPAGRGEAHDAAAHDGHVIGHVISARAGCRVGTAVAAARDEAENFRCVHAPMLLKTGRNESLNLPATGASGRIIFFRAGRQSSRQAAGGLRWPPCRKNGRLASCRSIQATPEIFRVNSSASASRPSARRQAIFMSCAARTRKSAICVASINSSAPE